MKKKLLQSRWRALLSLMLACMMILALAACGTKKGVEKEPDGSQAVDVSQPVDVSEPEDGGEDEYDPLEDGLRGPEAIDQIEQEVGVKYATTYLDSFFYTNSSGVDYFYAIAEVQNTGSVDLYMKDCVFELQDSAGNVLATCPYADTTPTVLAPGDTGYFYYHGSGLESENEIDTTVPYILIPNMTLVESENKAVVYTVSDTSLTDGGDYASFELTGRVTNTTDVDESLAKVAVVLYREDKTPIVVSSHYLSEDIAAGETADFSITDWYPSWDFQFDDIASYTVYAGVDSFQW